MNTAVPIRQAPATLPRSAEGAVGGGRHYRVFLSYSHADTRWANWLLRRLEGFRVPARLHGRDAPIGLVGPRIAPIFRDRDELPTSGDLGETIRTALRESATLVAICSRRAAKSRWVENEILEFKRLHGGAGVFAFIIDGDPASEGGPDDCFSPALRRALGPGGRASGAPVEVVAADARPHADGRRDALLRLVAGLLGVGFDELRQRELQRRHRRSSLIAAGTTVGMAVTLGLAALAWQARDDARRRQHVAEDLIGFTLGDLRVQLERAGRIDLLESLAGKAFEYFDQLESRDLTDAILLSLARAHTQVGDLRVKKLGYAEAARAYLAGYGRAKELAARHPTDPAILFVRGQAEYGIGDLYYRRGHWIPAKQWWTRYRETTLALTKLEPENMKWQHEVLMGYHNLAAIDVELGDLRSARQALLVKLAVLQRLMTAAPKDAELISTLANTVSFLGTVAERSGDFGEAVARFDEQIRLCEALRRDDPQTSRWIDRLANCLGLQAGALAVTGERAAARERRARALRLLELPVVKDDSNRSLSRQAMKLKLDDAMVVFAGGDVGLGRLLLDEALSGLEALAAVEPTDRRIAGQLATALRFEARLRCAEGRGDASTPLRRALALGAELVSEARANEIVIGEYAQACVLAGTVAAQAGDRAAARAHWEAAWEVVGGRSVTSSHWRILDPAARALARLGRHGESRALITRLDRMGYRPLEPWPEPR